jgi:hypothetical protein
VIKRADSHIEETSIDLAAPFDLRLPDGACDRSGFPIIFVELLRRHGNLVVLEELDHSHEDERTSWSVPELWRDTLGGATRLVMLQQPRGKARYALILPRSPGRS